MSSQLHTHSYPHSHAHIVPNFIPTPAAIRGYLADNGFLNLGPESGRVKYARAGSFIYVPDEDAANFDSLLRLSLLQFAMAEELTIRFDLPEQLRA